MKFVKNKRHRTPSVIIVSLIDVLLVVLIFLMVSTTFKSQQNALKLTLPKSQVAKPGPADPKNSFTVAVSTNFPYFYIEDKPVTADQVQKELQGAIQKNPQLVVKIKADRQSPIGEVFRIYDAAKLANASAVDILTEKITRQQ